MEANGDQWVAWVRFRKRDDSVIVKRKSENRPYGYGWEANVPTVLEVEREIAKRAAQHAEGERIRHFENRPDVIDARRVHDAIEWASVDKPGAINAVPPELWREIVQRIKTFIDAGYDD